MHDDANLSYAAGPTDSPLLAETIGQNLARTVAEHGNNDALVEFWTGRRWTYTEFDAAVDELACALIAAGLTKGDRVGCWSPNCAEWTILQYATAKLGVILVNINPAYRTHELAYALNQSECTALFAARSYKTSAYAEMVQDVDANTPFLKQTVYWGDPSGDPSTDEQWQAFLPSGRGVDRAQIAEISDTLSPEDAINIQYTSGTTGYPKGATLSHINILNNGYFVGEVMGIKSDDRLVIPVPFYHCFGMVMSNLTCTSHGSTMILPNATFEPASCLKAVQAEKATALHGVPTMFIAEQNLPDFDSYDLSTLRTGIMAGSPCPVEVMKKCMDKMHMSEVCICYGMTETSPVSAQTMIDDDVAHRCNTVGRVHPHVEVKVIDPVTGKVLPRGETGEFCTRGYSVMMSYWNEESKTAEALDDEGWMHTGDLAVMMDDGYLQIVGRIKDMVIRGGENIYPREIEEFLYAHPDITDVQVVGVPDEKYGEELCAFVQIRPGAPEPTPESIREFTHGKLAHYKIPKYVMVVDDFPMTVSGKVRKIEMRQTAAEQLGL